MESISLFLIEEVLSAFTSDSFGRPNTREVRAEEFKDCDLTFEPGFKTITPEQLRECYERKIYQNSFSIPFGANKSGHHRYISFTAKISK